MVNSVMLDENVIRKDFTYTERVAIKKALEQEIKKRQGRRTDQLREDLPEVRATPGGSGTYLRAAPPLTRNSAIITS
jgi:hypothetical protein